MKIAHGLLSHEFAGAERHLAELANWQSGQGHSVHLLLETLKPEIEKRWRAAVPQANFHFLPAWWPSTLSGLWALAVLQKIKPNIYHAHLGRAARRLGWGARMLRIPFVATLHLNYRRKEHAQADGLIRIANWQKADMQNYTGKATTIWNWVQKPQAAKPGSAAKLRAAWGAGKNTRVFLSVGRLVPQKGMDVLIDAFQKAFKKTDDVMLVILGEGHMRGQLQHKIQTDKRIVLAGYVADTAPYYAAANVFGSAARYEPFGLAITEGMAVGLPLVCTRTQGPAEFLAGVKSVRWAKPDDVSTLATALQKAKPGKIKYDLSAFRVEKAGRDVLAFYRQAIRTR
ncbi:MAG TPA: glycosyltransferase [Alphaproteobacteria bacterium]|nr:glycosyltransferase [Alphaproteobacteria bacterium]